MDRKTIRALIGASTLGGALLIAQATVGQETAKDKPAVKARVADLAWMSGVWRGKDEQGEFEETWSGVANGSIIGMFRVGSTDKTTFFEFESLTQEGEQVVLRIRHYREKMVDVDAAPQVWSIAKLGTQEAVFESPAEGFTRRLRYWREGENLMAHVDTQREGKPLQLDFKMARAK